MVDLANQYHKIKSEIDSAIASVLDSTAFINGPAVKSFETELGTYLDRSKVIACGNGTDALQIALMALDLQPGDEVIVPAFTYIACAEVIALLKLKPVWVDVDPGTFNLDEKIIEASITPDTKAIIVVHLFGQCAEMESILGIAKKHQLYVIEDVAQSLGADYIFSDGERAKAGTIGHIGCTSFFPSKILGCFGDGGAIITKDEQLATKLRMIANHGQKVKYYHELVGVNSRLDSIQAAVLNVKLRYIDQYIEARIKAANEYDSLLKDIPWITIPSRSTYSTHVFHQYTIKLESAEQRDRLKSYLHTRGVPSMIYYPLALHQQKAFESISKKNFPESEDLCKKALSLPIHTEMNFEIISYIAGVIRSFQ